MIQRNIPLSQQVANDILASIEAVTCATSDGLLPSEAELSQSYNVPPRCAAFPRLEQRGESFVAMGWDLFNSQRPIIDPG
jgi:hypothetical protein